MARLPTKKSEALLGKLRKSGESRPSSRSRKDRTNWTRQRLDYAALEAAKIPIEAILYKEVPAGPRRREPYRRELKVAILPWSRSGYFDIRFYINGKPTGQGCLIHLDHMAAVVSATIAAERQARGLGLIGGLDAQI